MSGAVPLPLLYDFMVWIGQSLLFTSILNTLRKVRSKEMNTKGLKKETLKRPIKRIQRKKEINKGKSEGNGVESEERREMK